MSKKGQQPSAQDDLLRPVVARGAITRPTTKQYNALKADHNTLSSTAADSLHGSSVTVIQHPESPLPAPTFPVGHCME